MIYKMKHGLDGITTAPGHLRHSHNASRAMRRRLEEGDADFNSSLAWEEDTENEDDTVSLKNYSACIPTDETNLNYCVGVEDPR